eukprot:CAMPEP_0205832642 /NCGR_PEP_ID=MMETSP0206-20130828/47472_1 /ASSEMBLY_ACC=CAM_ASM_000279 /TAXON_ID=36767 /ORGANISM="Euplotes focardii, Strain TN1" /LENGTH=88 /DNA_ID=CAMNT_0053138353 /DNA_START=113 /DNA_END=375 /DNA_ORIENTATION=-
MHDEETVEPSEQDFSDDEQEKDYKRIIKKVKNQRKRKRRETDQQIMPQAIPQSDFHKKRDVKLNSMAYQQPQPYNYSGGAESNQQPMP